MENLDNETLETERNKWEARARKLLGERKKLRAERDEWKKKYEAAAVHGSRLRAYNESMEPLIEAAQELNNSYHDVYAVNKVRKAYQHIEDTWEDV